VIPAALRRPVEIPLHEKPVWSVADAARATTLSTRTIVKLIADGKLPAAKVGRRVLLDPVAVKRAIFGRSEEATST
jgi:excisionase family DNA binding protein